MSDVVLTVTDPASAPARWALAQYFVELGTRFAEGFDVDSDSDPLTEAFRPPRGLFVLGGSSETPIACGAVHFLDAERGEIKRMWVAPSSRGQGLATRLLAFLEDLIVQSGRRAAVLDTNESLTAAIGLYETSGYRRIERYNDNPHAHFWFRKELG